MVVATHIVKVRGTFDKNIWNDDKLRKYVRKKIICEIDDSFHTHLELFKIDDDNDNKCKIEVLVYIYALPSEIDRDTIKKWIDDHIMEERLVVEEFEFSMMIDTTKYGWKERPFINIPSMSFDDMDDDERKLYFDKCNKKWKNQHEIYEEYYSKREERRKEEGISHIYKRGETKTHL